MFILLSLISAMHLLTYSHTANSQMAKVEKKGERSSMRKLKSICVFGGSHLGKNMDFVKAAVELGKVLAARGINLVYGGGIQGLRGCTATSAIIRGSKILGVTLMHDNIPFSAIGTELKVSNLPERLGYMFKNAEAFIALPGGLETFNGISSITYWAKLNFHKKPIGLLNINGFYDSLLSFLDQAVEQEFISQDVRRTIISAATVDELIDQLQNCAPAPDPLVKQVDWQLPDSSKNDEPDTTLRL